MNITRPSFIKTSLLLAAAALFADCSGMETKEERPLQPKITRLAKNVLEIETYGYDISLEQHLTPNKLSVIELGAYWCSPCKVIQYQLEKNAAKVPDLDFILMDVSYPIQGQGKKDCIYSPAYERYVLNNLPPTSQPSFPTFMVYQSKNLKGIFDYSQLGESENRVEYVVRKTREIGMTKNK